MIKYAILAYGLVGITNAVWWCWTVLAFAAAKQGYDRIPFEDLTARMWWGAFLFGLKQALTWPVDVVRRLRMYAYGRGWVDRLPPS